MIIKLFNFITLQGRSYWYYTLWFERWTNCVCTTCHIFHHALWLESFYLVCCFPLPDVCYIWSLFETTCFERRIGKRDQEEIENTIIQACYFMLWNREWRSATYKSFFQEGSFLSGIFEYINESKQYHKRHCIHLGWF